MRFHVVERVVYDVWDDESVADPDGDKAITTCRSAAEAADEVSRLNQLVEDAKVVSTPPEE